MKKFTRYDLTTGRVVSTGQCDDSDFRLQARPGVGLVEGAFHPSEFYWDGTAMVPIPPKPSEFHVWDATQRQWTVDLAMAAEVQLRERNARLRACDWTQVVDIDTATQEAWQPYRQALRDITSQPGYPLTVDWPTPPA